MATLVVSDDVVLLADKGELNALATKDGEVLWSMPVKAGFRSPEWDMRL